jgi:hypothetical protein
MRLTHLSKTYSFFLIVYGVIFILFLIVDFTYSRFFLTNQGKINIEHKIFHHHLLPNSKEIQGGGIYPKFKVITNSLGFRDSRIRKIDLKKKNRIVFIGDSFTFGVLLDYEFTVPGLADIYFKEKGIEVLNAGVSSYSPSIYYNKIKFFIEQGLKFSHIVVFIDISDIEDEAVVYVTDEQTKSVKSNPQSKIQMLNQNNTLKSKFKEFLKSKFNISYTLLRYIDYNFLDLIRNLIFNNRTEETYIDNIASEKFTRDKWTIDENVRKKYDLGIQKSIYNMSLLKNLLDENQAKLTIVVYP